MTTPVERTRAIRFGWEYLNELLAANNITTEQRSRVERILRHYPSPIEIEAWASECTKSTTWFGPQLMPEGSRPMDPKASCVAVRSEHAPASPIERNQAVLDAYLFFRIELQMRAKNLTNEQRRQLPYVLRHFPETIGD